MALRASALPPLFSGAARAVRVVVTTDRRTYYMRLVSKPRDYMARVAFTYPDDQSRAWAAHIAQRQAEGLELAALGRGRAPGRGR